MINHGDREALSIPDFDDELDDFAPRGRAGQEVAPSDARAIDAISSFPSREGSPEGQLNLKGPRRVLDRFKAMSKADRRSYYAMLEILMDSYEGKR